MDEIQDLLSRLESLTADEMTRLNTLINDEFDRVAGAEMNSDNVTLMGQLADAMETVKGEVDRREALAAETAAKADEVRARVEALRNPPEDKPTLTPEDEEADEEVKAEGEDEVDDEEAEEDDKEVATIEAEGEDTTEGEGETLPIAASSISVPAGAHSQGRAARMAGRHRAQPRPTGVPIEPPRRPAVVAGAGLRDLNPGDTIESKGILAAAFCDMLMGLDRDEPATGRHTIARARWTDAYPEDRRLGRDANMNTDKIEAVCGPQALVASGGVCLPVNVDYSVPTWAGADRPLRDALPAFQADRGGIRYVTPPDIGIPSLQATASGLGSATGVWTEATDASPAGQTKPVYQVACGAEQLVYVNAIPTRVGFGNMQGRFAPEQVAANTDLAISVAAREAELELLQLMLASTKQVVPQQYLGAARDLLATTHLLVAQYRYSHRIPDSVGFVGVFPEWAKPLLKADLLREVAHDNAGSMNVWDISDAQLEAWIGSAGISNVIWTLDGVKAGTYGTGGTACLNQYFGLMPSNAPEPQWPNQSGDGNVQVLWMLFPEGSYQFLDGGRLDLGVIRDSTLDATNDYETFVETFESVAFRGIEAYQVQQPVKPTGGSAGTVAGTSYHE
jgi:hypothetical protein